MKESKARLSSFDMPNRDKFDMDLKHIVSGNIALLHIAKKRFLLQC